MGFLSFVRTYATRRYVSNNSGVGDGTDGERMDDDVGTDGTGGQRTDTTTGWTDGRTGRGRRRRRRDGHEGTGGRTEDG